MFVFHPSLAIFDIGGTEILIVLLITLLLFGSERLPDLARNLGKSMREFKKAASNLEEEFKRAMETPPPPPSKPVESQSPPPTPASPPSAPSEKPNEPPDEYPYPPA